MQPTFVIRVGRKHSYDIDVELLKFVEPRTPGEKTLNAEIANAIAEIPTDTNDLPKDEIGAHDLTMRLTYASPRLLSARFDGYEFEGGAHGNTYSYGLNVDMASGRKLAFADAFDAVAQEKLDADCLAQIVRQKKQRTGDAPEGDELKDLRKAMHASLGDFKGWSFSTKGADVVFGAYDVGSYAEGAYSCAFPLARLKGLAKVSFPLPE